MRIPHPDLGLRNIEEFTYLGDACLCERPQASADHGNFCDYLYLRDNPAGPHRELWFHEYGDQSWLIVTRDTCTHEILAVEYADAGSTGRRA